VVLPAVPVPLQRLHAVRADVPHLRSGLPARRLRRGGPGMLEKLLEGSGVLDRDGVSRRGWLRRRDREAEGSWESDGVWEYIRLDSAVNTTTPPRAGCGPHHF
jgi:hypothetical protein